MAEVAKQPPRAGGGHRRSGVVYDDGPIGGHACSPHLHAETLGRGQRVASALGSRVGELPIKIDEHGARDVCFEIRLAVRTGAELPADVQDRGRGLGVSEL
jgi:hypothetical protein